MEPYQFEPVHGSSSGIESSSNDDESESGEEKVSTDGDRTLSTNWCQWQCGRCNMMENRRMCIFCEELQPAFQFHEDHLMRSIIKKSK